MLNRRQLVRGLASVTVLGSPIWSAIAQPRRKPARVSLEGKLSKAVFVALLGETFTTVTRGQTVALQLAQIDDGPVSAGTEQFTLVFRGPYEPTLADDAYAVNHHTAGSTVIFFTLTGHDAQHVYYEAPFNLLV